MPLMVAQEESDQDHPREEEGGAEVRHRNRNDWGWWIKTGIDVWLLAWHTTLLVVITLQAMPRL